MIKRVVIIGLDGATFRFINPLIKGRKLPTFEYLINNGTSVVLKSTYPPMTAAAWISMITGMNPGKHGWINFLRISVLDSIGKTSEVASSLSYRGKSIFDIVSSKGKKVASIRVPVTYPPWPINGIMVCGSPTPDDTRPFTYPETLANKIGKINLYKTAYPSPKIEKQCAFADYQIESTLKIFLDFYNTDYTLFMVVFPQPDGVQHAFWRFLDKNDSPFKNLIYDYYIKLDNVLSKILEKIDLKDTLLMIVSDHGGCPLEKYEFNLNVWLEKEGYLKRNRSFKGIMSCWKQRFLNKMREKGYLGKIKKILNKKRRISLRAKIMEKMYFDMIDFSKTIAFAVEICHPVIGIAINRIYYGDNSLLLEEIKEKLLKFKNPYTGDRVVKNVFFREELYKGEYVKDFPELIVELNLEYNGSISLNAEKIITKVDISKIPYNQHSSRHGFDGICIFCGPHVKKYFHIKDINIIDIAPTVISSLGIEIPNYMDGTVRKEIFDIEITKKIADMDNKFSTEKLQTEISKEEQEKMKEMLKGLGYL